MRFVLIILYSILSIGSLHSQRDYINFDIWEASITKVASQVLDIHQDSRGYIWLSTFNGVIRFDGKEFVHLADIYPAYENIPSSHISCVRIDAMDNIWIGTIEAGLFQMDAQGQLFSFNENLLQSNSEKLEEYRIENILFHDSILFIEGRTGLSSFQKVGDKFEKKKNVGPFPDSEIKQICLYKGDVLFTTKTSIGSLHNSVVGKNESGYPYLFEDKKNVLWKSVTSKEGTILYFLKGQNWVRNDIQPLTSVKKHRVYTWDYQNRLWGVKYNDNLIGYDFENEKWLIEKGGSDHNLIQRQVRVAFVDNSGTVWIGSDVISLYRKRQDIRSIKIPFQSRDEMSTFILEEDRILYSKGYDGLFILDKTGKVKNINSTNSSLARNRYLNLHRLGDEMLGVSHSGGFQTLDKQGNFSKLIRARGSNRSMCLAGGYYWIGGVSKLIKVDPATMDFEVFPYNSYNKKQNIYINGLAKKSNTELYVGSNLKALHVFDITKGVFYQAPTTPQDFKVPYNNNHISISSDGVLAIASENGLYTYDGEKYELHIPRTYFKAIAWSNDSLILASTKDKIFKYDLSRRETSILSRENGLLNTEFSLRSIQRVGDEICFGGNYGLDCIQAHTPENSLSTILNLESLVVNNTDILPIGEGAGTIELPQNTRHIVLKLNQIFTKNQNSAKIVYKNNDETIWQELVNNTLVLDNPRPGNHSFEFKTSIDNYAGEEKRMRVDFSIPIPWYKQFAFWLITCIISIGCIAWLVTRSQNKRKEKELEEVQLRADIAELRLKALGGQMNPHFTFNALNSILQMINEKDMESAALYVQRFSRMLRFVIEYSDQSWVSLEKEVKFLEDYLLLERMRFNDSFDYVIEVDKDIEHNVCMLPPFFLQPKIENALKHGIRGLDEGGRIDILIHVGKDSISAQITDNGIGRAASTQKSHFQSMNTNKGIALTEQRLEQLKKMGYQAELQIEDLYKEKRPSGTRVKLILPLKKARDII